MAKEELQEGNELTPNTDLSLRGALEQEKFELDKLNLEVARFRVKCGMSIPLAQLYSIMGKFSKVLIDMDTDIDIIDRLYRESTSMFGKILKDKEEDNA